MEALHTWDVGVSLGIVVFSKQDEIVKISEWQIANELRFGNTSRR